MEPKREDGEIREEALRILYRLRAELVRRPDRPPGVQQAIETLIEKYEAAR